MKRRTKAQIAADEEKWDREICVLLWPPGKRWCEGCGMNEIPKEEQDVRLCDPCVQGDIERADEAERAKHDHRF